MRRIGAKLLLQKAGEQIWGSKRFLGLRCNLSSLPPIRHAKVDILMKPCDAGMFIAFRTEFEEVSGSECIDVVQRIRMCDAGVQTLYCCFGANCSPAYVQWLITAGDQDLLHHHQPERYPHLSSDEVLLEGAYTFSSFRRRGLMADGMGQLVRIARDKGAQAAFTYVASDNVPSPLGCASVGFRLDHVRVNVRRLGYRTSRVCPVDEKAIKAWAATTSPRPPMRE